jgi:metal-dependent amidase/aminoacylase/carboxypeptidase family protein
MHMTVAVGIAEALVSVRDDLQGTVKFIFQPSEENTEGAAAVIADGALENPAPSAIFAVHCAPLEVGTIGSRAGMLLGGIDLVQVEITGDGEIEKAAGLVGDVLSDINTVDMSGGLEGSGESDAFVMAAIFDQQPSDGGGVMVTGIVRASGDEEHKRAKKAVEENINEITVDGVKLELTYTGYVVPPVMNDTALVERGNAVIEEVAGEDALYEIEGVIPFFSEDFAHFQKRIPGVMYYLGVSNSKKGTVGLPHSPMFVADEGAIVFGAFAMANILADYLAQH